MKQKSIFLLLLIVGILILAACGNSVENELDGTAEVEREETSDFDVESELAWMEEMNSDVIDSGVYLLNRDEEPVGPTISYSLMEDESDTETRYKLYGSFNGERYEFEMGYYAPDAQDRKSTRLNSSHVAISYAVFCLKKKIHTIQA